MTEPRGIEDTASLMAFETETLWVEHPGAMLRGWMIATNTSKEALIEACGFMPEHFLDGILDGSMKLSGGAARSLERGTRISAEDWLHSEREFRKGIAQGKVWEK